MADSMGADAREQALPVRQGAQESLSLLFKDVSLTSVGLPRSSLTSEKTSGLNLYANNCRIVFKLRQKPDENAWLKNGQLAWLIIDDHVDLLRDNLLDVSSEDMDLLREGITKVRIEDVSQKQADERTANTLLNLCFLDVDEEGGLSPLLDFLKKHPAALRLVPDRSEPLQKMRGIFYEGLPFEKPSIESMGYSSVPPLCWQTDTMTHSFAQEVRETVGDGLKFPMFPSQSDPNLLKKVTNNNQAVRKQLWERFIAEEMWFIWLQKIQSADVEACLKSVWPKSRSLAKASAKKHQQFSMHHLVRAGATDIIARLIEITETTATRFAHSPKWELSAHQFQINLAEIQQIVAEIMQTEPEEPLKALEQAVAKNLQDKVEVLTAEMSKLKETWGQSDFEKAFGEFPFPSHRKTNSNELSYQAIGAWLKKVLHRENLILLANQGAVGCLRWLFEMACGSYISGLKVSDENSYLIDSGQVGGFCPEAFVVYATNPPEDKQLRVDSAFPRIKRTRLEGDVDKGTIQVQFDGGGDETAVACWFCVPFCEVPLPERKPDLFALVDGEMPFVGDDEPAKAAFVWEWLFSDQNRIPEPSESDSRALTELLSESSQRADKALTLEQRQAMVGYPLFALTEIWTAKWQTNTLWRYCALNQKWQSLATMLKWAKQCFPANTPVDTVLRRAINGLNGAGFRYDQRRGNVFDLVLSDIREASKKSSTEEVPDEEREFNGQLLSELLAIIKALLDLGVLPLFDLDRVKDQWLLDKLNPGVSEKASTKAPEQGSGVGYELFQYLVLLLSSEDLSQDAQRKKAIDQVIIPTLKTWLEATISRDAFKRAMVTHFGEEMVALIKTKGKTISQFWCDVLQGHFAVSVEGDVIYEDCQLYVNIVALVQFMHAPFAHIRTHQSWIARVYFVTCWDMIGDCLLKVHDVSNDHFQVDRVTHTVKHEGNRKHVQAIPGGQLLGLLMPLESYRQPALDQEHRYCLKWLYQKMNAVTTLIASIDTKASKSLSLREDLLSLLDRDLALCQKQAVHHGGLITEFASSKKKSGKPFRIALPEMLQAEWRSHLKKYVTAERWQSLDSCDVEKALNRLVALVIFSKGYVQKHQPSRWGMFSSLTRIPKNVGAVAGQASDAVANTIGSVVHDIGSRFGSK